MILYIKFKIFLYLKAIILKLTGEVDFITELQEIVNCKTKLIKKFKIELIKYYKFLKQYMKLLMKN